MDKKLFYNPALESIRRNEELINKLSPAYVSALKYQSTVQNLANSPAFASIMKFDRTIQGLANSPAFASIMKFDRTIQGLANSPAFASIMKFDRTIQGLANSPAFASIMKYDRTIQGLANSPAFASIMKYDSTIQGMANSPAFASIMKFSSTIQDLANSPAFALYSRTVQDLAFRPEMKYNPAIESYQKTFQQLMSHGLTGKINSNILNIQREVSSLSLKIGQRLEQFKPTNAAEYVPEVTEELEVIYESIEKIEVDSVLQQELKEQFKQIISWLLSTVYNLRSIINTVDSEAVWKFLNKVVIVLNIYMFVDSIFSPPSNDKNIKVEQIDPPQEEINNNNVDQLDIDKIFIDDNRV
ncbi:hypothetical protein [Cytobacillus gottheilii]|uniref:Uncharacterized protein n=1 Tax=Cytobacillus gottheilii TaxID=859144 RepID=A0ABX8FIZ8_9BACI|nr:hypothetical protein [Cytobacillus gottheilii]QVY63953.1 hypothetical protein J1899_22200 [Cytobacillus gottheilii]